MDMKQSIEMAIFVIVAIVLVASFFNILIRERRPKTGYTYSGSGYWDTSSGSSGSSSDPSPFSGHSGHDCSHSGSSSDGGSCGGGDGGGGGGGD